MDIVTIKNAINTLEKIVSANNMSKIKDIVKEAVINFYESKMDSAIDADLSVLEINNVDIQDLVDEFGGNAPHSMNEYYRDGAYVPGNNTSIPASGEIKLTNC